MTEKLYSILSIRNRILVFAVLVTLFPSLVMGWLLNNMLQTTSLENVEQKLLDSSNLIEKEISIWLKEQDYDLQVFANSFIITDGLSRLLSDGEYGRDKTVSLKALETYLTSVGNDVEEYSRLALFDRKGNVIAASRNQEDTKTIRLPKDAAVQVKDTSAIRGKVYNSLQDGAPMMLIGAPVYNGVREGYSAILAVEIKLQKIFATISNHVLERTPEAKMRCSLFHLDSGRYFFSTHWHKENALAPAFFSGENIQNFDNSLNLKDFIDLHGVRVVGVQRDMQIMKWGLIVSEDHAEMYARAAYVGKRNAVIVCILALLIGVIAYFFTRQIIVPLQALAEGAQKVADGDLDVRLPIRKNDELGFTIKVFNGMVENLKKNRTELEKLAITDSLTKLNNRKMIMQILQSHFGRFRRYKTEFALLMIDADHFKEVNDTYGHLAGDEVLRQLAKIFNELLRTVDSSGRYGGEEFLVILAETSGEKAMRVAERIRQMVESRVFVYDTMEIPVTVSIGVAMIAERDSNEEALVYRADMALYKAKRSGRNRVAYLEPSPVRRKEEEKVVSIARSM